MSKPSFPCKRVSYSKYGSLDSVQFKDDTSSSGMVYEPASSVDVLVSQYSCTVKNVPLKHPVWLLIVS